MQESLLASTDTGCALLSRQGATWEPRLALPYTVILEAVFMTLFVPLAWRAHKATELLKRAS